MSARTHKVVGYTGDVNWLEYGGGPVYQTEHGFVMEHVEPPESDGRGAKWTIYRVDLDIGVPSWGDLDAAAQTSGQEPKELRRMFLSGDPMERAYAYETWAGHYGWHEFDSYALTLSKQEINRRYFGTIQALAKIKQNPLSASAKTALYVGGAAALLGTVAYLVMRPKAAPTQVQVVQGHRYQVTVSLPFGANAPDIATLQQRLDSMAPNMYRIVSSPSAGVYIVDVIGLTHMEATVIGPATVTFQDLGLAPPSLPPSQVAYKGFTITTAQKVDGTWTASISNPTNPTSPPVVTTGATRDDAITSMQRTIDGILATPNA